MASKNGSALILKRPLVDKTQAAELARQLFGFHVSSPKLVKELVSYDDRNFYLKGTFKLPEETRNSEDPATNDAAKPAKEEEFVLKVLNRIDSALNGLVDAQNEMMLFLNQNGVECSCPVKSLDGNYNVMWKNNIRGVAGVHTESVRLLKFVPGKLLRVVPCSPNLLGDLGRFVANFSKVLKVSQNVCVQMVFIYCLGSQVREKELQRAFRACLHLLISLFVCFLNSGDQTGFGQGNVLVVGWLIITVAHIHLDIFDRELATRDRDLITRDRDLITRDRDLVTRDREL